MAAEDVLVTVTGLEQAAGSAAVGVAYVATAEQVFVALFTVTLLQPDNTGAWLSVTVTVNEQVAELPLASVTL